MKRIFHYIALAAVALGFSACSDDTDPKAQYPTDPNFLNIPVMANQTLELKDAGKVEFTLSQPNYGVAVVPDYTLQISLDPNFEKVPSKLDATTASLVFNKANEKVFYQLPKPSNSAAFSVSAKDIADGISAILGYDDLDQYKGREDKVYRGPLYCRVLSTIPTANPGTEDGYSILSNVVKFNNVVGFPSVRQPGVIYLVGAPSGWMGPDEGNSAAYAAWGLYENKDGIDSKVYYGIFEIPAGQFTFRFYTALTGWDGGASWGPGEDDTDVPIKMTDGVASGEIQPGKSKYTIPDWPGGWVKMTVNLANKNVQFVKVDGPGK